MSQLALARKYRPRDFQALVGQEVVVRALSNALAHQRLHHAYLFTGTRGVGKTTIARILAKCLNCERGISATPCNTCSACQAIDMGQFVDLIEVDAASRTKVEDTRDLLDNVQYLPTRGRFKIYLIDEVHMLSSHSFNALLKTLEEPPLHVKFLLATTDPQKLPATILSRCLQFHLWRVPVLQIKTHLAFILQQEKMTFEADALILLSRAAEGSLRDALSLLDQALSFSDGQVTASAVREMLGLTEREQLWKLFSALAKGDSRKILAEINELAKITPDFSGLLTEFLMLIHQVMLVQMVPEILEEQEAGKELLLQWSKDLSKEEIQLYYQIGLQGQRDLPYAPHPKMGFEMVLLRMVAFQPIRISAFLPVEHAPTKLAEPVAKMVSEKPEEIITSVVKSAITTEVPHSWNAVVEQLNLTGLTKVLAEHCVVTEWSSNMIHLTLDSAQKPLTE